MNVGNHLRPLVAAAALLAAGTASAEIQVFTDEASFLAALANYGTDTFDDLVPAQSYDGPLARSAGDYAYSVAASPNSPILYGAGTVDDAWLSSNNAKDFLTFTGFGPNVVGVGAYVFGSDIGGFPFENGATAVRVRNGTDTVVEFTLQASPSNYFGFLSDAPITSFEVKTFARRNSPTWPTVDDLTLAAAVPEPGTYGLMALGLLVVGRLARRRLG